MSVKYRQREMFEAAKKLWPKNAKRRYYPTKPITEDSVGEGMRQIPDGPAYYPESVVYYTRFKSFPLRALFAYLREKEHYLQKDLTRYDGAAIVPLLKAKLEEVEAHLIWMASNLTRAGGANGEHEDENRA